MKPASTTLSAKGSRGGWYDDEFYSQGATATGLAP
jgi:hypothetical protein